MKSLAKTRRRKGTKGGGKECHWRGRRTEHHFWQPGRGHDRNIVYGGTLQAMIGYVHLNPVRKGFVERACDWKWSSAGWFAGEPKNDLEPDPIPADWLEQGG